MSAGIQFFNPAFQGSPDEALRWIVEHQLAPTPLERVSFAETALENAVRLGARQYLILGAGYDTFALRRPDWAESLRIFELDRPASSREKQERLRRAGIAAPEGAFFLEADFNEADWQHVLTECPAFSSGQRSFCSLLGLTYYIPEETFCRLLADLGALLLPGSSLAFDYPCRENSGSRGRRQAALGGGRRGTDVAPPIPSAKWRRYSPAAVFRSASISIRALTARLLRSLQRGPSGSPDDRLRGGLLLPCGPSARPPLKGFKKAPP